MEKSTIKSAIQNAIQSAVQKKAQGNIQSDVQSDVQNEIQNDIQNVVQNDVENVVEKNVQNEIRNEVQNVVENVVPDEVQNDIQNVTQIEVPNNVEKHIELPFSTSHAFIIGINDYEHVSQLSTAVNDATVLAENLEKFHGYQVHAPLLNATKSDILKLLNDDLPNLIGNDDRVLFYFAGHGIALDSEEGPNGYIVAADTKPGEKETLIPMDELHDAITSLPCRHGLLILDCCFAGAFKWSSGFRDVVFDLPKIIYEERFWRYCKDPAWQVITSSAYDQKAVDIITNQSLGLRENNGKSHSPFASALFNAFDGDADIIPAGKGDGIITATELYTYLRDLVETETTEKVKRQSPSLFNLQRHDKGEYVFLHPNHRFNLPPTPDRNPFMGLSSFNEEDATLFFGRDRVVEELLEKIKQRSLIVVCGASGTGKSSVIKAGVLPQLRKQGHHILPIIRPGKEPMKTLQTELPDIKNQLAIKNAVLVIDQYEELITQCLHSEERNEFEAQIAEWLVKYPDLHILLSIRSDFEPQFESEVLTKWWLPGRYVVPAFSLEEIREVITKPAAQSVLFYEPEELIDQLGEEVSQAPGALPLLSFTLSELYHAYLKSGRQDRALKEEDYNQLGGVIGALRTRADAEYKSFDTEGKSTMRKLMMRMVSLEGGELAGKRVYAEELIFSNWVETKRMQAVADQLVNARLLLKGKDAQDRVYVEPAHDALVRAWARLWEWIKTVGEEKISLQYKLSQAVNDYNGLLAKDSKKATNLLWNNNPRLDLLKAELIQKDHGLNALEETFVRKSVQHRTARKRLSWAIAFAVMVGLAGLALYAFTQQGIANEQTKIAEDKTEIAEQKTVEAQDSALSAKKQRLIAQDSAKAAQKQRTIAILQTDTARMERKEALLQAARANRMRNIADKEALNARMKGLTAEANLYKDLDPVRGFRLAELGYREAMKKGLPTEEFEHILISTVLNKNLFNLPDQGNYQEEKVKNEVTNDDESEFKVELDTSETNPGRIIEMNRNGDFVNEYIFPPMKNIVDMILPGGHHSENYQIGNSENGLFVLSMAEIGFEGWYTFWNVWERSKNDGEVLFNAITDPYTHEAFLFDQKGNNIIAVNDDEGDIISLYRYSSKVQFSEPATYSDPDFSNTETRTLSPSGKFLAIGYKNGEIKIFYRGNIGDYYKSFGNIVYNFSAHPNQAITEIIFCNEEQVLKTVSGEGAKYWPLNSDGISFSVYPDEAIFDPITGEEIPYPSHSTKVKTSYKNLILSSKGLYTSEGMPLIEMNYSDESSEGYGGFEGGFSKDGRYIFVDFSVAGGDYIIYPIDPELLLARVNKHQIFGALAKVDLGEWVAEK